MSRVTAMVLVGGRGTRLGAITQKTAKPAVSFGGKYKLIDFVLSNLSNSSINQVGLITQYEPHDLMDYIGFGSNWDLDVNQGGVSFLTPYTALSGDVWQKGTAHAIKQHWRFLDRNHPDYVLILGGDHIYKMDYNAMIEYHKNQQADMTIAYTTVTKNHSQFGILETKDGLVTNFIEKPQEAISNQASMGIYVFNRSFLQEVLESYQQSFDFGGDVIPIALEKNKRVAAFAFEGYFRDVGTVESLYEANMDLIDSPQLLKLYEHKENPIYTKSSNLPPHHIVDNAVVQNSYISDGCLIYGTILHSIISAGCYVKRDAVIRDSIIHENVEIGRHVEIKNCIVIPNTNIPDNMNLVFESVTVVDQTMIDARGEEHG